MVKDSKIQFIQSLIEEAIEKKILIREIAIEHELSPQYIHTFIACIILAFSLTGAKIMCALKKIN